MPLAQGLRGKSARTSAISASIPGCPSLASLRPAYSNAPPFARACAATFSPPQAPCEDFLFLPQGNEDWQAEGTPSPHKLESGCK